MENTIVLITGGTGTFGKAFIDKCLQLNAKEIRVFSRDEKKQYEMKYKYNNPKLSFFIGDIRDKSSLDKAMKNVDYVFHAAAMKQVPTCETYPEEAIKTNVHGSLNVLNSAIEHKVKKVVCLSTDKAVYPISTMGLTKSLMEKIALAKSKEDHSTTICVTRFCNLIVSNGSAVPLFMNQIENNQPLTVTDPNMTRFFMSTKNAIDLVYYAFKNGENGDIFIQHEQPCKIGDLAQAVRVYMNCPNHPIQYIGARKGEKLHEKLITDEEFQRAICENNYIVIKNNGCKYNNNFTYSSDLIDPMNLIDIVNLIEKA